MTETPRLPLAVGHKVNHRVTGTIGTVVHLDPVSVRWHNHYGDLLDTAEVVPAEDLLGASAWTVVTRKLGARTQFSPTGFVGTWHEAVEEAARLTADHDEIEAWYVAVDDTRVLLENGRWVGIKGAPKAPPVRFVVRYDYVRHCNRVYDKAHARFVDGKDRGTRLHGVLVDTMGGSKKAAKRIADELNAAVQA